MQPPSAWGLGVAAGLLATLTDIGPLDRIIGGVAPLDTLFVNAIRMVVIPLVVTTIFVGVASLGNPGTVGKLGGSALGFFWGTTIPAIAIGIAFMKIALGIWPVTVRTGALDEAPSEVPGLLDFLLSLNSGQPLPSRLGGLSALPHRVRGPRCRGRLVPSPRSGARA